MNIINQQKDKQKWQQIGKTIDLSNLLPLMRLRQAAPKSTARLERNNLLKEIAANVSRKLRLIISFPNNTHYSVAYQS